MTPEHRPQTAVDRTSGRAAGVNVGGQLRNRKSAGVNVGGQRGATPQPEKCRSECNQPYSNPKSREPLTAQAVWGNSAITNH